MPEIVVRGAVGDREIVFRAGKLAMQADGAVTVSLGDTQVLVTATANKALREGADFFPLTVDVEERMYAAGKIPGSFFRREGAPPRRRFSPPVSSTVRSVPPSPTGSVARRRWWRRSCRWTTRTHTTSSPSTGRRRRSWSAPSPSGAHRRGAPRPPQWGWTPCRPTRSSTNPCSSSWSPDDATTAERSTS